MTIRPSASVLLQLILGLPLAGAAHAQQGIVEITAFGEFEGSTGQKVKARDTASGFVHRVGPLRLVKETGCITASIGKRFGIMVGHLEPRHPSFIRPVRIVVSHPPFSGPGGTGRTRDSWPMNLQISPLFIGWLFENAYELTPGPWTIAVTYEGEVLAEKTFDVRSPKGPAC